jgi:hypothetical protein
MAVRPVSAKAAAGLACDVSITRRGWSGCGIWAVSSWWSAPATRLPARGLLSSWDAGAGAGSPGGSGPCPLRGRLAR